MILSLSQMIGLIIISITSMLIIWKKAYWFGYANGTKQRDRLWISELTSAGLAHIFAKNIVRNSKS